RKQRPGIPRSNAGSGVGEVGGIDHTAGKSSGAWRDSRAGGSRVIGDAEGVVEGEKSLPVDQRVGDASACTNHGLSVTGGIPGDADAGRKIRAIALVGSANAVTHPKDADVGDKIGHATLRIAEHVAEFVARAKVERHSGSEGPA